MKLWINKKAEGTSFITTYAVQWILVVILVLAVLGIIIYWVLNPNSILHTFKMPW